MSVHDTVVAVDAMLEHIGPENAHRYRAVCGTSAYQLLAPFRQPNKKQFHRGLVLAWDHTKPAWHVQLIRKPRQ